MLNCSNNIVRFRRDMGNQRALPMNRGQERMTVRGWNFRFDKLNPCCFSLASFSPLCHKLREFLRPYFPRAFLASSAICDAASFKTVAAVSLGNFTEMGIC